MAEGPDEGVGEPGVNPLRLACQALGLKDLIKEGGIRHKDPTATPGNPPLVWLKDLA